MSSKEIDDLYRKIMKTEPPADWKEMFGIKTKTKPQKTYPSIEKAIGVFKRNKLDEEILKKLTDWLEGKRALKKLKK